MTKDLVIIALGIWIALIPFLGFPNSWDRLLLAVSGLAVSILMYLLRRDFFTYVERLRRRRQRERQPDTYVENELPLEIKVDDPTLPGKKIAVENLEVSPASPHVEEKRPRRSKQQS